MLGEILIVSGPTVVTPILRAARTGKRLTTILDFEGTTIDPIGAIIAVVVFQALTASHTHHLLAGFARRIGIGVAGGVAGTIVLWLLLKKLKLTGILGTQAIIATVTTAASFSAPLIKLGIGGADKLLPATFLVIVGTVAIYGLAAAPSSASSASASPNPNGHPERVMPLSASAPSIRMMCELRADITPSGGSWSDVNGRCPS